MLTRFDFNPGFAPLFRDLETIFANRPGGDATLWPKADVRETETAVELKLDLPGVTPEAIDVKVEGDTLTIHAERTAEETTEGKGWLRKERTHGRFERSFTLGDTLDGSKPEAAYKHGVLTVTIPKKPEVAPRALKVKVEA